MLTYLFQGSILIALVEWLALFGAGVFSFKAANTLVGQEKGSEATCLYFILACSWTRFWWWLCSFASPAFPILFIEYRYKLSRFSKG